MLNKVNLQPFHSIDVLPDYGEYCKKATDEKHLDLS